MRESFLHFIWQFQKFNTVELTTIDGEAVQIYTIGNYNTDAGPDFLNAKLLIGEIIWYGHVELHLKSSDWNRHKHQHDEAYNNVVLHVVWTHDQEVQSASGQTLPVLELHQRINPDLLQKCHQLLKSPEKIPCQTQINGIKKIDQLAMFELAGVARLKQKSEYILRLLDSNNGSWEETTYQLLAKNFGFKINSEPFLRLAQLIDHKILVKHADKKTEIEALIFGMSGFLANAGDTYQRTLSKSFEYLSKKYRLESKGMLQAEWKYLRLRPGNFPSVRLAQFAGFLSKNLKYFNQFIHYHDPKALINLFEFEVSTYWRGHYDFGKKSSRVIRGMGKSSIDLILINTIAPLLAAYAQYTDDHRFMDKSVALLQSLKAEKNHIIRVWEQLGITAQDAFDSQALIGLRNDFCLKKKCLSCKIGVSLINN